MPENDFAGTGLPFCGAAQEASPTDVVVTVRPDIAGEVTNLQVRFRTGGELAEGAGIVIKAVDFGLPPSFGPGDVAINGQDPSDSTILEDTYEIFLTLGHSIPADRVVSVEFPTSAGIRNPNGPGVYLVIVRTTVGPDSASASVSISP